MYSKTYSVLIVEDEATLARNVAGFLGRHGFDTRTADTAEAALREMVEFKPDAIVLDFDLPGMSGLDFMSRVRATAPQIKLIMATGQGSEQVAVDAMKSGAYDYLIKPLALGRLKSVIDSALQTDPVEVPQPLRASPKARTADGNVTLVGNSPPMNHLRELIRCLIDAEERLADSHLPAVLITGETGTGKEVVARSLHYMGRRRSGPFVEVNCSSIPAHLLEAELFGYERGAFTDARERKIGLIEAAEHGTLFLDEVGEMDLALQAKLLKFLEDKSIRRLGSVREQKTDVRIVAATNRNLDALVQEGGFRADLLFRLRIVEIETPALRTLGKDDIRALARHFLEQHGVRYGKPGLAFSQAALDGLSDYSWPGNVRELRNLVEQAVILSSGQTVEAHDLRLRRDTRSLHSIDETAEAPLQLSDIERRTLSAALKQTGWNVTHAARLLGISRDTLRYRIDKHQLRIPS
ncbi:MAG: sigma-54-dependent Fis family transcriptional regulator [Betaproteobacteria bacterium]|nr:sigma-54-dependent Fis family transcriptional regulator [Betaproteobacteria bacterium]